MRIFNPPKRVEKDAYEKAVSRYCDKISACLGIVGVGQFGSVGAPGLSDIDLMVVTKNDFDIRYAPTLSVKGIDDNLFIHGPLIIPERLVEYLHFLIYFDQIKIVTGTEYNIPSPPTAPNILNSLSLCYLIDFTESRLFQIAKAIKGGDLDQRQWMTRIWSTTHSWRILERIMPGLEVPRTISSIIQMRQDWIDGQNLTESDFLDLFRQNHELNRFIFDQALSFYNSEPRESHHKSSIYLGDRVVSFTDTPEENHYFLRDLSLLGHQLHFIHSVKPEIYALHLDGYQAKESNPQNHQPWGDHYQTMAQRSNIVRDHWNWRARHLKGSGSMSGYLGFINQPFSIRKVAIASIHSLEILKRCIF